MMSWTRNIYSKLRWRLKMLALHAKRELDWLTQGRRYARRQRSGTGVIVSLTSYPPRFGTLHLTLKSLLSQTHVADRTILWIARGDMAALPPAVTKLRAAGLEIIPCDDLKSYKKMIPLLQQGCNAPIVIADDDVHYWPDWLEQLMEARDPARLEVICHRMHRVKLGADGLPVAYNEWEFETANTESSILNFPTGIGGVLYPPNVFGPEVLNVDAFTAYCPRGDDIWFWWMARNNGATFRRVPHHQEFHTWEGSQEVALWKDNLGAMMNDNQIRAMIGAYGFDTERKTT